MKYELKRFQIFQTAKTLGFLYAIMGLLFVPFFVLLSSLDPEQDQFGIVFALLLPAFYGILGFVMTAIGAAIYNWLAGWAGGIGFELTEGSTDAGAH